MLKRIAPLTIVLSAVAGAVPPPPELVTNGITLRICKLGVTDDTAVRLIDQQGGNYALCAMSPDDIGSLRRAGVPDRMISAFLKHSPSRTSDKANPGPPNRAVLAEGTRIRLRLRDSVRSSRARVGDRVEFEVINDVQSAGLIVLHRGAVAVGAVKRAEPKYWFGRGGKLELEVEYAKLPNGDRVALVGRSDSSGPGRSPLFLLAQGQDAEIAGGAEVDAYVKEDVELDTPPLYF
jgi:hypothetical protein